MDGLVNCYHPDDRQTLRTALIRAKEATDEVVVVTDEATTETVPTAAETGGQVYLPELRLRPDAAPDRVVESRIESVTGDGEVTAIRGAVSAVTDRRRREAELRRQNERLEQFAGRVSHDLRSPLSVAAGHLELLRDEHDSEHVERALDAVDRSHSLVSDLLTLARSPETVDCGDPVGLATAVERAWRNTDSTDARIVTETSRTVRANRGLLRQLLTNLLRNAVEHGSTDSRSQSDDAGVRVTVGDLSDGFYVADDGPGIPPADRDDVFESGYVTGEGSTGLGLAIVREVADVHGWEITVTESDDGGARFEVTGVETVATDTGGIESRLEQIDRQARDVYETLACEPHSIPELAAACDLSPSAVCRQLERLERHDLVGHRTRVADDGHTYPVYRQRG
jgi:signal transduction histidine kinase